jgi:hypothetical protein
LKGEEFKQTLNFDPDISDLTIKKSMTAISRSSSDKFSRLQKLEKKNLNEENLDAAGFTMTKNNLNLGMKP